MIKYIDQADYKRQGETSVQRIERQDSHVKTAQFKDLHEEIREFITNIKPKDGYGYLLISALTDENWGANNNADYFPEESLNNPTEEFGYKTYPKYGKWYRLHQNKDPEKSFGDVIFAYWSPQMHRVELIVEYNRANDDWTEDALRDGRDIEVSMGLKINYDVCPVCHPNWRELYKLPEAQMVIISKSNSLDEIYAIGKEYGVDLTYVKELNGLGGARGISRNADTYCDHIKYHKREVMPNGQKIYMVNLRPVFFDISSVRKHAEESSYVLLKVADIASGYISDDGELDQILNNIRERTNKSAENKDAEMIKQIDPQVLSDDDQKIRDYLGNNILPLLRHTETCLPNEEIDDMAEKYSIEEILSTFLGLGMFPKPREFQRIVLISMGNKQDADAYERRGMFIDDEMADNAYQRMSPQSRMDISPGRINEDLLDKLMRYGSQKSYYSRPVCQRITMIKRADIESYINPIPTTSSPIPTMLLAVAGYMAVAKASGKDMKPIMKYLLNNKIKLLAGLVGAGIIARMAQSANKEWTDNVAYSKRAEIEKDAASPLKSLLWIPGITIPTYVASENQRQKAMAGYPVNAGQKFLINNPGKISLTAMALAHGDSRRLIGKIGKGVFKGMTAMIKKGMDFNGINIEEYPPSDHAKIVVGLWDTLSANELEEI